MQDLEIDSALSFGIASGESKTFAYAHHRNSETEVKLFASVCTQPQPKFQPKSVDQFDPVRLKLSVNEYSDGTGTQYASEHFKNGVAMPVILAKNDFYITIEAPVDIDSDFEGNWNVRIVVTEHQPAKADRDALIWLDTDSNSVLFTTSLISAEQNRTPLPYSIFVYADDDLSIVSLRHSYCAMQSGGYIASDVSSGGGSVLTDTILGNGTRQLLLAGELEPDLTYRAYLTSPYTALPNANLGTVHTSMSFTTSPADESCEIIYDLPFCNGIAYKVPSNSSFTRTELARYYDEVALNYYTGFDKTLQQVQCDVANTSRYTWLRTCDDCRASYKNWLCLTTIPRCMSPTTVTSRSSLKLRQNYTQNRNFNVVWAESSYFELLPCIFTCHSIMQDCPALLDFHCPLPGRGLLNAYGLLNETQRKGDAFDSHDPICNFVGNLPVSAAKILGLDISLSISIACVVGAMLIM
ncbi:stretch-activated cation channel Mid1 [Lipomyces arxii]|uniref:stretch-activated cation channel Mid1 n=1 Tax=Lipomyces arxii TaxID=56418 RepID=UPI0034CDD763